MATFLIFLPPEGREGESAIESMRLVKDGFRFWAFLLGPIWFLAKRLWLGALLVLLALAVVLGPIWFFPAASNTLSWANLAMMLLIGLEASTIERWTLRRHGWREADIVVARNKAEAEQKAAERLVSTEPSEQGRAAMPGTTAQATARRPEPYTQPVGIIGLFPEPGGR